uniref:Uncharacterized protein n=1 Tax=Brassica campestris TaxID=3711 RepID=M4FAG0_BRACM
MVRLKKAVPPRETGITRRAVADLQAQIENLTAAVAALSTQHATPVFCQERNNQAERNNQTAIDDEFEEDKNPLSRLRCQPLIRNNNNNDSYFDNKYEDLDIKVYDTRDNDNSYVVQLGDDTEKHSTHDVANEDVTEIAPIYDMFEEDEMNQVIVGKVEDESIKFNESVYAEEIPTFSTEAFVKIMLRGCMFERNTTFLACWTNVIMVNWNINESSDSFLKNLIKENHAEVLTAIYDISFLRRLVSSLGSVLVYAFTGGEDSMFLWPLLAPTTSIRILGFSYNITVVFITRISSFLRMHILPLRFRKGSLESVVYWQVRHCGFHKLRIWDVDKLLKNLNDISTRSTWRSYVTCVSSKYLWEAYSCVIWWVHCNTLFLPLPSWIDFSTLLGAISQEVFPFQDPWNKVFQLLANYHLFHVKLCGLVQPPYIILWSLLKILLRSITTANSFDLLLVNMQLGVVQSSRFFVDSSSHHVNQVGCSMIYLIIIQEEFMLKHRLWRMTVFFPLNLLLLGLCFDVNVGKLGVMRTTSFRFSYDELMEIGIWCGEWFFRWVWPPSYLRGLVLMGIVDLYGAILPTRAFLQKVIIKEYLQLRDRMHFFVLFPREKTVMCFVNQFDKVLGAKVLEHLEFWASAHDLHSTRRTRFLHSTSYVIWLEQDDCTCDQAPVTLSWKIKGTYEIVGGSEERDKNISQMVLFNVWCSYYLLDSRHPGEMIITATESGNSVA